MRGISKKSLSLILSGSLAVSGCATGPGSLQAKYGAATDACAAERHPLIDTESTVANTMVRDAVIGVLVGAAAGALIGGGNIKDVLIGAGAGLAAGAGAGYLDGKHKQYKTQEEVLAAIDGDTKTDLSRVSSAGQAIPALRRCRNQQIDQLKAQIDAKQIKRDAAMARLAEITKSVEQDNLLVDQVLGGIRGRSTEYVKAISVEKGLKQEDVDRALSEATADARVKDRQERAAAAMSLKLYASASSSSAVVAHVKAGQILDVTSRDGDWAAVQIDGKSGFAQTRHLKPISPPPGSSDGRTLLAQLTPQTNLATQHAALQRDDEQSRQSILRRLEMMQSVLPDHDAV